MHRYTLIMRHTFSTFGATLSSYFRRLDPALLWAIFMVIVFLVILGITFLIDRIVRPPKMLQSQTQALIVPTPPHSTLSLLHTQTSTTAPAASSNSSASTLTQNESTTTTNLSVNNQPVPLPANGTVHKEINDQNGHTTLDVSTSSTPTGSSDVSSSTSVNLSTTTQSSTSSGDSSP